MITIPGKIPIRIHPFFWLLIVFIGWINSQSYLGTAIWAAVIFISVLIHEYGHALTAIGFGQRAQIELVALGGVTQRDGPKLSLWREFIIVLNGPLAGFLLCLAAYALRHYLGITTPTTPFQYALEITILANLFWTIVNLLPIYPLDGGHLMRIVLESMFGMRGIKASLLISSILSVFISLGFFMIQAFLAGALFLMLAFESYRAWKGSLPMTEFDANEDLQQSLKNAEDAVHNGNVDTAKDALQRVRDTAGTGVIYITATEDLADVYNKEGNYQKVYMLLAPIARKLSPQALPLLHKAAYEIGAYQDAILVGDRAYQVQPSYDTALLNALSYAATGQTQPAIGWLQRAISDGLQNVSAVLKKPEFEKLKSDPAFIDLKNRYF